MIRPMYSSTGTIAGTGTEDYYGYAWCNATPFQRPYHLQTIYAASGNFGHLNVGRWHIFDEIPKDALETKPLKIDWTYWCNACGTMASARTCPHDESQHVKVSGTKLRKLLSEDQPVPDNFSRPEVLKVLQKYYAALEAHEKVKVKLKGHSAR